VSTGCTNLENVIASRVEQVNISFRNGVIRVKGLTGERIALLQVKLSEVVGAFRLMALTNMTGTKQAVADLTAKVLDIAAQAYGKAQDTMRPLASKTIDGFLYVACQVKDKVLVMRFKVDELVNLVKSKAIDMSKETLDALAVKCSAGKITALQAFETAKAKASEAAIEVSANGRSLASNPRARVTAASAAGGAAVLGASGGAAGIMAGGAIGAVCAVPAAFFTFGLSIPVGIALGAGSGLCLGTAAGGTAGLVTGGAAGYGAHTAHMHKDEIASKAKEYKGIATASSRKLREQIMASTGSTFA